MKPENNKPSIVFVAILVIAALLFDVYILMRLSRGAAPQPTKVAAAVLLTLAALWMVWESLKK